MKEGPVGRDTADRMAFADQPVVISDEERRRAALTIAHHSTDVDDARDLLDALGLLDALRSMRNTAA